MLFPFIGALIAATSAFNLGAMSVKIAILSGMLYAVLAIAILIGLYAMSLQHRS